MPCNVPLLNSLYNMQLTSAGTDQKTHYELETMWFHYNKTVYVCSYWQWPCKSLSNISNVKQHWQRKFLRDQDGLFDDGAFALHSWLSPSGNAKQTQDISAVARLFYSSSWSSNLHKYGSSWQSRKDCIHLHLMLRQCAYWQHWTSRKWYKLCRLQFPANICTRRLVKSCWFLVRSSSTGVPWFRGTHRYA